MIEKRLCDSIVIVLDKFYYLISCSHSQMMIMNDLFRFLLSDIFLMVENRYWYLRFDLSELFTRDMDQEEISLKVLGFVKVIIK